MQGRELVVSFGTESKYPTTKEMVLEAARLVVDRLSTMPKLPPP